MALLGKLTIAYLQEDNPQKGYYRIRPLFYFENDALQMHQDMENTYPRAGYLRVVPDKNEIMLYKDRMRRLGKLCQIDLRAHPGENDKVRSNKNHASGDVNAWIVYSDVVRPIQRHLLAGIVRQEMDLPAPASVAMDVSSLPETQYLLVRTGDTLVGPYAVAEDGTGLRAASDMNLVSLPAQDFEAQTLRFELPTGQAFELCSAVSSFGIQELPEPAPHTERAPVAEMPEQLSAPRRHTPERAEPEAVPTPPAAPAPRHAPEPPTRPEPQHLFRQNAPQYGNNQRRGRSLYDVVDEQWRQARYDQLGHPVPPEATGRPVESPVERAVAEVMRVFAIYEARGTLAASLLAHEGLREMLAERLFAAEDDAAKEVKLHGVLALLESERLEKLDELQSISQKRETFKKELLQELRVSHVDEMKRLEQERDAKLAEGAQARQALNALETSLANARAELDDVLGEELNRRLAREIADARAADMLRVGVYAAPAPLDAPDTQPVDAGQLLARVRECFAAQGMPLTHDAALALLAAYALGGCVALSGPAGCGKSTAQRALPAALGVTSANGRYAQVRVTPGLTSTADWLCDRAPSGLALPRNEAALRVLAGEGPRALALDQANAADPYAYLGALIEAFEAREDGETFDVPVAGTVRAAGLRVLMSVQDDMLAHPLTSGVLDQCWFVRLPGVPADQDCAPSPKQALSAQPTISETAFALLFDDGAALPEAVGERLAALRKALAAQGYAFSRRALRDVARFVSAVLPLWQGSPLSALDAALAMRAMPALLASANLRQLAALPALLVDLPGCAALMNQPLPLPGF